MELMSIEERLQLLAAKEERDRREAEKGYHPGDARPAPGGDILDELLTSMANTIAAANRERSKDAERDAELDKIIKEIQARADKYLQEAQGIKELAQRSREVDKAQVYFSQKLEQPEDREKLFKAVEQAQRRAEVRAIELQRQDREKTQERDVARQRER